MTRASLTQWDARTAQLRWWGWKEARGTRGRCLAVRSCREAAASMAAAPRRDAGTSKGRPGIATPVEVAPWPVFVAEAQRVELSTSPLSTRPTTSWPVSSSSRATPAPSVRPDPPSSLCPCAAAPPRPAAPPCLLLFYRLPFPAIPLYSFFICKIAYRCTQLTSVNSSGRPEN